MTSPPTLVTWTTRTGDARVVVMRMGAVLVSTFLTVVMVVPVVPVVPGDPMIFSMVVTILAGDPSTVLTVVTVLPEGDPSNCLVPVDQL